MSSFQSFKSFMKIEENNPTNPTSKPNLTNDNNEKEPQKIQYKQTSGNPGAQAQQKNPRRLKKTGTVCNFIAKVYSMLQDKQIESIISWSSKQPSFSSKYLDMQAQTISSSFQIFDIQKFEEIILPKYFKHSNMSSFVRQLNMYGFHKLRGEKNNFEFQHEKFQRNRRDLLSEIRRKSPEFMGISSSHLDDPTLKSTLQNFKAIDDKINYQTNRFVNTQQEIESFREELNESNLFPSEGFIPIKKISLDEKVENQSQNSLGKDKLKKMELIEEQNNRLKKIKAAKVQKIKDLNSVDKEKIQTKFFKILFTFLTLKIKSEFDKSQYSVRKNVETQCSQKAKKMTIQSFADHIMGGSEVQSFESYKKMIEELMGQKKSVVQANSQ